MEKISNYHPNFVVDDGINNKGALLTQMSSSDEFYDQYTIYPLADKRKYDTSGNLYQMKKVLDNNLSNQFKSLDLMCFPDLFWTGKNGQHEERAVKLTDALYIKTRLKSKHPQYRLNIQYLFFVFNDATIREIRAGMFHALNVPDRRVKITAGNFLEMLNNQSIDRFMDTIFARIRNTEPYWRKIRNNLQCMVDSYGPATFFVTISPSEWLWTDLTEYIRKVNAPFLDKIPSSELIARDPVSAARFIDNKFHAMLHFICSDDAPLGKVIHYFWRREYQGRGTQHYHMLFWIENAPTLGESTPEEVSEFIMKYITCKIPDKTISPTLYERVTTHQKHTHNDYCMRTKKTKKDKFYKVCRFGFPRPVTENLILRDAVTAVAGRKTLKKNSRFYDLPRNKDEQNINDYNPTILFAWEGNMDIQYIGEKTRIASEYVTKYGTKAGEKSYLINAFQEVYSNKPLASKLYAFIMRSLSHRECGALEAADTVLGISLYGTDPRTTIRWLDVNEFSNRKLKNRTEIEKMDKDSVDIFCPNLRDDQYPKRPKELESCCLYEFAKWYDIVHSKPKNDNDEWYEISNMCYLKKRKYECLINHFKYNIETYPEKYFFSLLLLFQPWRDILELKNGCQTYAESFHQVAPELEKAQKYHEKRMDIKKAFDEAEELVKEIIEMNNREDLEKSGASLDDDLVYAHEALRDLKEMDNQIVEKDISEYVSQMNEDQKRVFNRVTKVLLEEGPILRLYVSGEGGTGKSFLITALRTWVKQEMKKCVAVGAPTGIAAYSINGLTIHKLFQLPVEHGNTPKYRPLSDAVLKILREDLKDVALIIIDEVSMISNVNFLYIHKRLTEIINTEDVPDGWFGRKHILLFGDLLQLPPVLAEPAYKLLSAKEMHDLVGCIGNTNLWKNLFEYDELTINMRQRSDTSYRDMLRRIRIGYTTKNDRDLLESRKIHFSDRTIEGKLNELCNYISSLPIETVCLFPTRHMCNVLNEEMLSRLPQNEIKLIAHDSIECKSYLRKKLEKALQTDEEDCSRTGGLPRIITIKIGAKIMLTRNIDVTLGLVNGTIGRIVSVSHSVDDKNDIQNITISLSHLDKECVIEKISTKFELMPKAYVIRKQFPICLSYAITIHKSQGLSLKNAVIDAGNRMFAEGQGYVALSRVTTLGGLHLVNFDPSSIIASTRAINEYNRLRSKFRPNIPPIEIFTKQADKVFDAKWHVSGDILRIQDVENETCRELTTSIKVRGLGNIDGVSCYANSVFQCFFNFEAMKNLLLRLPKHNVTRTAFDNYRSEMNLVDITAVRQFVGSKYGKNEQQNVTEFINAVLTAIPELEEVLQFSTKYSKTCSNEQCKYSTFETKLNTLVELPVTLAAKKSVTLQQLFDEVFHKRELVIAACDECNNDQKLMKIKVLSDPFIMMVKLLIFHYDYNGTEKKNNKCSIKGVSTAVIKFGNSLYKVIAAICHSGSMTKNGHYYCYLKHKKFWIKVDDLKVEKSKWPYNSKEVYILFLERQ